MAPSARWFVLATSTPASKTRLCSAARSAAETNGCPPCPCCRVPGTRTSTLWNLLLLLRRKLQSILNNRPSTTFILGLAPHGMGSQHSTLLCPACNASSSSAVLLCLSSRCEWNPYRCSRRLFLCLPSGMKPSSRQLQHSRFPMTRTRTLTARVAGDACSLKAAKNISSQSGEISGRCMLPCIL